MDSSNSKSTVEDVVTIDVHVAKDLLNSGHRYLDVRTNEEFNKSHADNALNIPYMFITQEGRVKNPEFIAQVSSLCDKEDSLIVGYKNVKNMAGGYSAWVDNGFAGDLAPAEELKTACKFRR
uniref:protein HIGH ARSENIC CONTENT 1, mitochondrial isoform X2 n=1 Tax=Erigeron canadensis TaxID=72917 RepID=UPI001CB997E4|nr:protein HIGH ARSENIC CONTENT 1, mitochondrial isoform X2 [Erigeron canadensis]